MFIKAKTFERQPREILLNISDEACLPFGFLHKEIAIKPDGLEAIMMGVAPDNDGENVMWYTVIHPSFKDGEVCYWGGCKNLLEAGFVKKQK